MARLGSLYPITSGGTPSRKNPEYYVGGNIPWVKTGDLKEKYLSSTEESITEEGLNNSSARIYPPDTVLLAMYGATIGASSILKVNAATNQACAAFVKRDDVLPEYLFAFLESQKSRFEKDAVGGAQPNISAGYLKEIDMPLLPMDEQRQISTVLDKVSDLIAKRRTQLDKLDELVKSRFIELFGDPIHNTKGFSTKNVIDVVTLQRGFDLPVQDRNQEGDIPVYGSNGVLGYHDESKCEKGVITGRSGTLGEVTYCNTSFWPLNTTLFSVNTHGNNIVFLKYLLEFYDLKRFSSGTGVPTLNRNEFHNKAIIDVPIDLQNEFATFVEQTDKLKLTIQQSLDKLETMKKALMQQYFG